MIVTEKEFLVMQRNLIKSFALSDPPKQKKSDYSKIDHEDIK